MKEEKSSIIYKALCDIKEIESPQIDIFNRTDPLSRPIYFTFRFVQDNSDANIVLYNDLIKKVRGFKGNLSWIMHNDFSRKNYTIEPLKFYEIRSVLITQSVKTISNTEFINALGKSKYIEVMKLAIEDIFNLAQVIFPHWA